MKSPNTVDGYATICIRAMMVMMWLPTGAYAAIVAIDKGATPLVLDPVLIILTAVISTLAGATTLAIRLNAMLNDPEGEDEKGRPKWRPWPFCIAHMLGSWLAGTTAFLIGRSQSYDVWNSLLLVLLLAFLGAKGVETIAQNLPVIKWKGSAT